MFDYKFEVSLTNAEIMRLNAHFTPIVRHYGTGESITTKSSKGDTIGIMKRGTAYLFTINRDAQRRILDCYAEGDMFRITSAETDENLFFTAKTACDIDFISYDKLITLEDTRLRELLADRLFGATRRRLLNHLDIMGQRTLRNKLTVYFEVLSHRYGKRFTLPLPYADLADYIGSDRSAMMREIAAMTRDGIITANKGEIELL